VNATTELGYVYRDTGRVGRVTLFNSLLHDMLRPGGVAQPFDARARGIEAEWSQQVTQAVKIDTNISHVNTQDPRNPKPLTPDTVSSGWLGNVAVLARPMANVIVGARWSYVGDRVAGPGFNLIDVTVSRQELFVPGLALRAGIKNVGNDRVTYLTQRPTGEVAVFEFPRRAAWVELSWRR